MVTAIYGLWGIECTKDTSDLIVLPFSLRLKSYLKIMINYDRGVNGNLVSDGALAFYQITEVN